MWLGWIFVVVGVLGFFSNPIVGEGAIFHTDLNHNLVHLISGALLLWVAYAAPGRASMVLKVLGVVYLLVLLAGFFMAGDTGSLLGFMEINDMDNWLHLVLAAVLLWGGFKGGRGM